MAALAYATPLQFIPARGRKPLALVDRTDKAIIAIYPRKGTETYTSHAFMSYQLIAIYPRKGTETIPRLQSVRIGELQFIPARGRKPEYLGGGRYHVNIAIYPRKGTETPCVPDSFPLPAIAIYPRKGTETFAGFCTPHTPSCIAIYPRKGTETCMSSSHNKRSF